MEEPAKTDEMERISPPTYLILNLAFWAFCGVQYLVARWWLGPIEGISIFFFALAAGFTFVCVFDFLWGLFPATPEKTGLP
jgi:hypothetical protein